MIDAKVLGGLLFGIHNHAEIISNGVISTREHGSEEEIEDAEGEIYYSEEDIIKLLKKLGFPEPEWGISIDLDDYKPENNGQGNFF